MVKEGNQLPRVFGLLWADSEEVVETEEEQTTIEPGDPEDIGPDAPQVTAPPGDDDTYVENIA